MDHVSSASIVMMTVSMLVCIILPAALAVYMKRRVKAHLRSMWLGMATFVIFALVIERSIHLVVLNATGSLIIDNVFATAIYGGLMAGLFEETGRFLTQRFLMKKTLSKNEALMYGVGHGGIEAILIGGAVCLTNLITAVLINTNQIGEMLSTASSDTIRETLEQQVTELVSLPEWQFLLAGGERISAILLQICLSYIVYLAVKHRSWKWFGLAVFIHALVDGLAVIAANYISALTTELLLFAAVLCLTLWVAQRYRREPVMQEE